VGLDRIFKGIKKVVKKIGRGIKKVAKKVGKFVGKIIEPFQKLGIVGQIGLMFLMPHAAGWLWKGLLKMAPGALAGSNLALQAGTKFSLAGLEAVGAAMTSPTANIFQRIIGRTAQAIHTGGTAFQTVTGAIGDGIDWVAEKGRELFGSETGVITDGINDIKMTSINPNTGDIATQTWGEMKASGEHLKSWAWDENLGKWGQTTLTPKQAGISSISEDVIGNVIGTEQAPTLGSQELSTITVPNIEPLSTTSLLERQPGTPPSAIPEFPTTADIQKQTFAALPPPEEVVPSIGTRLSSAAASGVTQGLTAGIKEATASYISNNEYGESSYTPIVEALSPSTYTKFNEVDLMDKGRGHYYGGQAHQANLNQAWNDPSDIAYWETMRGYGPPPISQAPAA
tara:strand:+ start:4582 stop:5775 length:1194 start_codon:yes stop_codon:yes gene_type:complete